MNITVGDLVGQVARALSAEGEFKHPETRAAVEALRDAPMIEFCQQVLPYAGVPSNVVLAMLNYVGLAPGEALDEITERLFSLVLDENAKKLLELMDHPAVEALLLKFPYTEVKVVSSVEIVHVPSGALIELDK